MSNIKDVRCKPRLGISWSKAAMLRDVILVVVGRTRPRSIPLAILTIENELHGSLCMHLVLFLKSKAHLEALRTAGAQL